MKLILTWRSRRRPDPLELQAARFRQTLHDACQHTRFYGRFTELANLTWEMPVGNCLPLLPTVELTDYLGHRERFENRREERRGRRALHYPLPARASVALLVKGYKESRRMRFFGKFNDPALARFAPDAVAGRMDTLRSLAWAVERGYVWLPPLTQAVIVVSGILEGPLTPQDRDLLWRAFHVPVFEQFRGFDGELLAWECEAHQGLHICPGSALFESGETRELRVSFLANPRHPVLRLETGLEGEVTADRCDCGENSSRLVNLSRRAAWPVQPARMLAAAAAGAA